MQQKPFTIQGYNEKLGIPEKPKIKLGYVKKFTNLVMR